MKKRAISDNPEERKNAAGRELFAQARDMEFTENMTWEEWELIPPPVKITAIIQGFYAIRNSAFKDGGVPTLSAERCLALAVKLGDFQLIADAALSQIGPDTKEDLMVHALILANDIHQNPSRHGFSNTPAKADILRYLEEIYPKEFATIPPSSRGKTDWWKKVSLTVSQARGY